MKPAIYLRVSTPEQSIEAQRAEVLRYCKYRAWPDPLEFSDVISGSRAARPGLDALIRATHEDGVDTIVSVKLDRLGRSLQHVTRMIADFEKRKIALVFTSQGIDTSTSNAMGAMQLGILAVFAQFERTLIQERTKAGMAVARANGVKLGRPSPTLVKDWPAVVAAWKAEEPCAGYAELSRRLGYVSKSTAWRLANQAEARSP